jgi:hypothetical protein
LVNVFPSAQALMVAPTVCRPMKYVTTTSFFGFGSTLYGWRRAPANGHIVTRWITLLLFPIVPVRSYVVDFTEVGGRPSDHVFDFFGIWRYSVAGQATSSPCWRQVINTFLYAYLPWVIALCLGPVVPDFVAWIMASLILGSWFFAAIMMRRTFRGRTPAKP